jgi:hypothetical protein
MLRELKVIEQRYRVVLEGTSFPMPKTSAGGPSMRLSRRLWRNRNGTGTPADRSIAGQEGKRR